MNRDKSATDAKLGQQGSHLGTGAESQRVGMWQDNEILGGEKKEESKGMQWVQEYSFKGLEEWMAQI